MFLRPLKHPTSEILRSSQKTFGMCTIPDDLSVYKKAQLNDSQKTNVYIDFFIVSTWNDFPSYTDHYIHYNV